MPKPPTRQRDTVTALTLLRTLHEQAKTEAEAWGDWDLVVGPKINSDRSLRGYLDSMGLIETREGRVQQRGTVKFNRITMKGLHCLAKGKFGYAANHTSLSLKRETKTFFDEVGAEMGVMGARTVLDKITERPAEFRRWFRAMFG